jgi:hypothetical protein
LGLVIFSEEESFGERLESNTCVSVKDQIRKKFCEYHGEIYSFYDYSKL